MLNMLKKTIIIFLLAILVISCVSALYDVSNADWSDDVYNETNNEKETEASTKIKSVLDVLVIATRIIGVAVAIVMLITLAAKYMMAAPGDRADIKKSAIPFVVGAFILFSVSGILSIILKFSNNINS